MFIGLVVFFSDKNQPKKATKCQRRNFLWASENVGLIQSPSCQVIGIITPGNQLSLGSVGLKSWGWWNSGLKMKLKTGVQSWSLIWDEIWLKGIKNVKCFKMLNRRNAQLFLRIWHGKNQPTEFEFSDSCSYCWWFRNPAPVDMINILFAGFYASQVVGWPDFPSPSTVSQEYILIVSFKKIRTKFP